MGTESGRPVPDDNGTDRACLVLLLTLASYTLLTQGWKVQDRLSGDRRDGGRHQRMLLPRRVYLGVRRLCCLGPRLCYRCCLWCRRWPCYRL